MSCRGIHCPGCGDNGGGGALVVLVAVVIVGAIVAKPVEHAADELLHVVLIILEVTAITAASLGAIALAAVVTVKARRRRAVSRAERPPAVPARSSAPVAGNAAAPITARRVQRIGQQNRAEYVYQVTTKEKS